ARTKYTLIMDAMTWDQNVRFRPSIVYDSGSPQPAEVAGKDITLEQTTDVNTYEWKEYRVVLVVPDGHPAIGEPIGIRWWCYKDGLTGRWPFLDYIRVTSQPATDAWKPNPGDEEINVDLNLEKLTWEPGLWAKKHSVYFGTNWADVNSRDPGTLIATQQDANEVNVPIELIIGGEYFWAVDEYNDTYVQGPNDPPMPPWTGEVWSFKTNDGKAYDFSPGDEATDIATDVNLIWSPGVVVDQHRVYFSTSFEDVNSRAEDANQGLQGPNTFDPTPLGGQLALEQTYYWAVDEVNDGMPGSPWQSAVLEFTTIDHVLVEDFNAYVDTAELTGVWKDYWTNSTGSEVFIEKDVNFVEDGSSMMFTYDNQTAFYGYYSEAYADISSLGIDPDWTYNNVQALRLAFMGQAGNALDQMYVALTDSSNRTGKVIYPDPNEQTQGWKGMQEWNILLSDFVDDNSVDLSNISRITIGFGDKSPGDTGAVWFDNIKLHPPRCVLSKALDQGSFDLDEDCLVDYYDLDVLAQRDWLLTAIGNITAAAPNNASTSLVGHWPMDDDDPQLQVDDTSGNVNHGLLYDDDRVPGRSTAKHSVDPGYIGKALSFDGFDDYVEIQPLNLNTNEMTISAWVRRQGSPNIYSGIVFTSDPCSDPNTTAGIMLGADTDTWEINNELAYMWTGDAWSWHTDLFVPDYWCFVALTIAPDVATLYLDDGLGLKAARNYVTHDVKPWSGLVRIGDQMQYEERIFRGAIDDVRIYNYTLTPAEILYLALQGAGSAYVEFPAWRADADNDDKVNFKDFGIMADNWLQEALWP
ncbi:MAG: LamG domain-containing protein, partial [Planctomycetota bacterium]